MNTVVVIPTYNERENLQPLVSAIFTVAPAVDILVVDDNSPDGTGAIADDLARRDLRVQVLHRQAKDGLGRAYIAGFERALAQGYQYIVEMDADFSHRPEDLPRLLAAARTADVVIGSRNIRGGRVENWPLQRKLISKGGSHFARSLLGMPIHDCTGGFKCFRREVLLALDLGNIKSNGYGFQVEMNYRCYRAGFRIVEIPIVFPDRRIGQSKMSQAIVLEAAKRVWELRREQVALPATAAGTRVPSTPVLTAESFQVGD